LVEVNNVFRHGLNYSAIWSGMESHFSSSRCAVAWSGLKLGNPFKAKQDRLCRNQRNFQNQD
jgi:hypothetical protein